MTVELFLLGIAFPDATELTGDVLLFMLLAPLQFFNRYVGLKLSGERPRLIALYRHIFTLVLLLWLLLQLAPIGYGANLGIHVLVYAALTAISTLVLVRILYRIWRIETINADVLFGIIICYATVIVIGFSAATALGLASWMGIQLTPPSAAAPCRTCSAPNTATS